MRLISSPNGNLWSVISSMNLSGLNLSMLSQLRPYHWHYELIFGKKIFKIKTEVKIVEIQFLNFYGK